MDPWQQAWRTAQTPVVSTVHHPFGRPGGPGLWHTGKELPAYIQNVAHAFRRQGATESEAIERAVGVVRDWAEGHDGHGNKVHPDVQAAAAKAIAEWEKLRAEAHAKRFNTHHGAAGSGHGGQFVSASGSNSGKAKTGGKKPAATGHTASHPTVSGRPGEKRRLLAQAHADRMRIRRLEQQLHQLEQQHRAAVASAKKAAATAKKTTAAAKKAASAAKHPKHATATHHKHTTTHAHHARSLSSRISALRQEIGNLRKQASQLEARAKAL